MHAAIHELLNLRDGQPVDVQAAHHVEHCGECSAELLRLKRLQQRMQSMAGVDPPDGGWQQVSARMQAPLRAPRNRIPWAVAAAFALAVASGLVMREFSVEPEALPMAAVREGLRVEPLQIATPESLDELVAQSRELDTILQILPERPAVERVAQAATIDTIEQRVQWLDQQLAYAPDIGLDEAQAYQLWRERVDLMDSLVKVRYAEGAQLSF